MKKYTNAFLALALFAASQNLNAGSVFYSTQLYKITVQQDGLCTLRVQRGPASEGLTNCENRFVSLDCAGEFGSKSAAANMLATAQLAMVANANKTVSIAVTDTQISTGTPFCVAYNLQWTPDS